MPEEGRTVEHSHKSAEHGTPVPAIEFLRYVMGGIDFDPASSAYWNHSTVKATEYCDKERDGLKARWWGRVICNPPGDTEDELAEGKSFSLPRAFWERGIGHRRDSMIQCMGWIGFNMSQLQTLQLCPMHPLQFYTLFPATRLDYLVRPYVEVDDPRRELVTKHTGGCRGKSPRQVAGCRPSCQFGKVKKVRRTVAGPPKPEGAPPRPSYITFVPPRQPDIAAQMVSRFLEGASRLDMVPGAVTVPMPTKGR